MKIKLIDASTKKPIINTKVTLQVKGEGDQLHLTTDMTGMVELEDTLKGRQITAVQGGTQTGVWVTINENAVLLVSTQENMTKA